MRSRLILCLFLLAACLSATAQYFTTASSLLGFPIVQTGGEYGNGISFHDVNNDGLDDITCAMYAQPIILLLNNGEGFTRIDIVPNTCDAKHTLWVDYDNDGDKDLFVACNEGQNRLFRNNGSLLMTDVTATCGFIQTTLNESFGCSWGDYDGDGWLDLYVGNYNDDTIPNWLYHNNGDGTFTEVAQSLGADNGTTYTLQACFADINNDLRPDIIAVNDKEPLDAVMIQHPDGTFEDIVPEGGFDYFINSMTNSIADFDYDGDLDVYITNGTPFPSYLFQNNGDSTFTSVGDEYGLTITATGWAASWTDINNDRWVDLYIATQGAYGNNLNKLFIGGPDGFVPSTQFTAQPDGWNSVSIARGDYNNDGHPDLAVTNMVPEPVRLYRNNGNQNHSVRVRLEGSVSNRDGIGTWVEWWVDGVRRVEYTQCGTNFLGQDSQTLLLSVGNALQADSVRLTWRSGIVDVFAPLPAGEMFTLVEGSSRTVSLAASGDLALCPGDSVVLFPTEDHVAWTWSDGSMLDSLVVTESGSYWVQATDAWGLTIPSDTLHITVYPAYSASPSIIPVSCAGGNDGSIILAGDLQAASWNTGAEGPALDGLSSGTYTADITDTNGCVSTWTYSIAGPAPLEAAVSAQDATCSGSMDGALHLSGAMGGTPPYTWQVNGEAWIVGDGAASVSGLAAGAYDWNLLDAAGCALPGSAVIAEPAPLFVAIVDVIPAGTAPGAATAEVSGGTPPYSFEWSDGTTAATADGLEVGTHSVTVTDAQGCTVVAAAEITVGIDEAGAQGLVPVWMNGAWHAPVHGCASFVVRDAAGRLVRTGRSGERMLGETDARGIYLVRLHDQAGRAWLHRLVR